MSVWVSALQKLTGGVEASPGDGAKSSQCLPSASETDVIFRTHDRGPHATLYGRRRSDRGVVEVTARLDVR